MLSRAASHVRSSWDIIINYQIANSGAIPLLDFRGNWTQKVEVLCHFSWAPLYHTFRGDAKNIVMHKMFMKYSFQFHSNLVFKLISVTSKLSLQEYGRSEVFIQWIFYGLSWICQNFWACMNSFHIFFVSSLWEEKWY